MPINAWMDKAKYILWNIILPFIETWEVKSLILSRIRPTRAQDQYYVFSLIGRD